jgi:hypothetical protein
MARSQKETFLILTVALALGMGGVIACDNEEGATEDGERPCALEGEDPGCPDGWVCRTGSAAPSTLRCYSGQEEVLDESLPPISVRMTEVGVYTTEHDGEGIGSPFPQLERVDWGCEMAVVDNLVYMADLNNGLLIVDVTLPSNPVLVGQLVEEQIMSVAVEGDTAYLVQRNWNFPDNIEVPLLDVDKILSVNVENPISPELLGYYNTLCTPWYECTVNTVVAADKYLFFGSLDGLDGLDVSNPAFPHLAWSIGNVDNSTYPGEIFIDGDILYYAYGVNGFYIFDISDPGRPKGLAEMSMPDAALDVFILDGIAYLTLGDAGIMTIDVHDPSQPKILGSLSLDAYAYRLGIRDGLAYVTYKKFEESDVYSADAPVVEDSGIMVVDVRDSGNMAIIETLNGMARAEEIAVQQDNNLVFLNDLKRGLVIFEAVYEE